MATITDPILGVPSTILDIPDYQHEYVNTPVPYADMLPVPQPPRGLVFPDNVPPVLANLNAMHPTNRQAQTLNTDGNHALLVSDVSGGGATAGAPIVPTSFIEGGALTGTGSSPVQFGPQRLTRTKLLWMFGAAAQLFVDPGANNTFSSRTLGIINTNDQKFLPLVVISFFLAKSGSAVTSRMAGERTVVFANGLDLTTYFPVGADLALGANWDNNNAEVYAFAVQ